MLLRDITGLVDGNLENSDPDVNITGVNTLKEARPDQASFLANMRYKIQAETSHAGILFLDDKVFPGVSRPIIRVVDPYLAFALLQRHFHPERQADGLRHESAVIDVTASLAEDVDVVAGCPGIHVARKKSNPFRN